MDVTEAINVINTWELPMRKSEEGNDFANEFLDAVDVLKRFAISNAPKKRESRALKLCRCGTKYKPSYWYNTQTGLHFFKCDECKFKSSEAKTEIQARRNWNREVE